MSDDRYVGMLRELLIYDGGRLSGWEIDFLEGQGDPDELTDDSFTDAQKTKLEEIWGKVFG